MNQYDTFIKKINDINFYSIRHISDGVQHSNILLKLKIVLEETYFDLFTSSYFIIEKSTEKSLRTRILNPYDKINRHIEVLTNNKYKKYINNYLENENKKKRK